MPAHLSDEMTGDKRQAVDTLSGRLSPSIPIDTGQRQSMIAPAKAA
ncbi:hypothetical protein EDC36_11512 [Tepidimonas ignava]|uniref:Uncharacterized protein n=1 Tax=Tepidimonas ignava TaxID=114249 RepID=A0A4R3L892_9BURK|nr:hypothetical protein EDC36_11512 [Tepidimonas ignava]TSE19796.1 hypothetical protein Tigna_02125 [Tepidimonas ignava]